MTTDTLTRHASRYHAHLKRRGYAVKTMAEYMRATWNLVGFLETANIENPAEITHDLLSRYQAGLYTTPCASGRPLALRSQALRMLGVLGFVKFLVREGVLLVDPGARIVMPRARPRHAPRNVPTENDLLVLLTAPNPRTLLGIRDRAMMEVLYASGIRVGELVKLTVQDVDLVLGLVRVIAGKGGRDRTVPMGRKAVRALQRYLDRVRPVWARGQKHAQLFVSHRGNPLWPTAVQRQIRIYATRAGLRRKITAHSLRHACATHMLRGKASIRHIQEQLGHRQLSTTQLYTQVDADDLKAVHRKTHPRERLGIIE
jgi:integrase/recombinase XerD